MRLLVPTRQHGTKTPTGPFNSTEADLAETPCADWANLVQFGYFQTHKRSESPMMTLLEGSRINVTEIEPTGPVRRKLRYMVRLVSIHSADYLTTYLPQRPESYRRSLASSIEQVPNLNGVASP